jgi:hypothetical protein
VGWPICKKALLKLDSIQEIENAPVIGMYHVDQVETLNFHTYPVAFSNEWQESRQFMWDLNRKFEKQTIFMRILVINVLLGLGLLAVVAGTIFMLTYSGYDDQISFTCFVLHSVNAILLLFREVLR